MTSAPSARAIFRRVSVARIDPREGAIDQIGAHFVLAIVVAPIELLLEDQHPPHDPRRCAGTPRRRLCGQRASKPCATVSITASSSNSMSILRNQSGNSLAHPAARLRIDCACADDAEPCLL